jgi:predicted DNA-binding transcriptional regulator AlpA
MRDGRFPRARIHGGRSMWLSTEIDWLAGLKVRPLKGDAPSEAA